MYLDTSHPENGSPMSELIGMANSKLPNSASLKVKILLDRVGIREAQEAKPKPSIKKKLLREIRSFEFLFMTQLIKYKDAIYFGKIQSVLRKISLSNVSK